MREKIYHQLHFTYFVDMDESLVQINYSSETSFILDTDISPFPLCLSHIKKMLLSSFVCWIHRIHSHVKKVQLGNKNPFVQKNTHSTMKGEY